jgi:hypothetical protein
MEDAITDDRNLLIDNHYFWPDVKIHIIKTYFGFLGNILDILNDRVLLVLDINIPGFD